MSLLKSMSYASRGIATVFKEERNFRIEVVAAIAVFVLMVFFDVTALERAILVLVVSAVLVLELLNSIVERIVDILKPRIHHYAQDIKDITAGAVLVVSGSSVIIGVLIFWPYFVTMIGK